ncbi:class I lanthipeptide [Chitinophaga varians]|uniref:class I lanthipeptide n=1 Tax=Chitinophaga varians TaxID=2202339 RepID=UPI00165F9157|nr:class I lanthipeptide [Chitinophaga varians]MBC9909527.1 class I lanthipeptide [Chitinophaga varians]
MKKKISLSKKLAFRKDTIAMLADAQRPLMADGAKFQFTKTPGCATLIIATC